MKLPPPPPDVRRTNGSRVAAGSLGTPADFRGGLRSAQTPAPDSTQPAAQPAAPTNGDAQLPGPRKQATETVAARAGALSDEIAFPAFVAGLVHGTFDAIVDSAIRQMESFASLVSAVAKPLEDFTRENVSENQAKDHLVEQYPKDLYLSLDAGAPAVLPRPSDDKENPGQPRSPQWLDSFGAGGQELTPELIQDTLIPEAQKRLGRSRQQMLATMVLLGLNRVIVKDGTISARLRFRAEASDQAKVDYAVSDDPGGDSNWGARGSLTYPAPSTKVSTVGVTAQSDTNLKAELFGEVKINFASETLPLEKFADQAKRTLLERHARPLTQAAAGSPAPAEPPVSAPVPALPPAAPGAPARARA
jgi:hypothetical protein